MLSTVLIKITNTIDCFVERLGRLLSWLTLLMVTISFVIVICRYVFNWGSIAIQESVLYLHGLVFMLGAAYTLKHDGHVRVDIFYQKFSARTKAWVNILGSLFLLLPVTIFIFVISYDYVSISWQILEKSSEAGGLPFVYLSKSYLLLFAITLTLQGLSEIFRNALTLLSNKFDAPPLDDHKNEYEHTHGEML